MITYTFPVILAGRWRWVAVTSNSGNKYEALAQYTREQAAQGVAVQGHDMSQACTRWN